MKIIFLDIDGVLNSISYFKKLHGFNVCPDDKLDPIAINNLNKIIDYTGVKIVLSSTWRIGYMHDLPGLQKLFKDNNIHGDVLGITPINSLARGAQIEEWLDTCNQTVESFIIIDDDNDMGRLSNRLIKTTISYGLLDEHIKLAIDMLK
jgi:hypothetical protein